MDNNLRKLQHSDSASVLGQRPNIVFGLRSSADYENAAPVLPRYFLNDHTYRFCDRKHFDDEDLNYLYREKARISMPNRFQENLGCVRASFSNEGLCPGDSGNTVGERNIISTAMVHELGIK